MVKVNLGGCSSFVKDAEYNEYVEKALAALDTVENENGAGNDFLGWKHLPSETPDSLISECEAIRDEWKNKGIDLVVVIGIGGSYLGAKCAIEALSHSFAKQLSSVAGRVDVGKKMQVSKTGLTSVAKQVQSGLDRTKLTLKLNKIDADASIKDIGKQIKAEVATVSVGDGVKLDGDALGVSGVDNVLAQTAEMTSKAVEGLGEAKSATASWKDQLKDLDRIMKSVTKSSRV